MKNLAEYIIGLMKTSSSWNEKFYQGKNEVSIYVDGNKIDVTEMWNGCLNSKGFFVRSEFDHFFKPMLEGMIDRELDAL